MAYQALYRQWRPTVFAEVIGQEVVVATLKHQIEAGRIAHAYLFCGCRGTGKTTIARIMSRAINCADPQHGEPCGECASCRTILAENTLDVVELDAASNNSVDNVRELLDQVRYPAQLGKYKVYIIDEVHMLSGAAFNALLKTLEEPPAHVVFILATTEPQKLPATILSRVQRYDFGRIPTPQIVERLRLALDGMNLTAEPEALQMVAVAAEGAMRDAFSIMDMCVSGATEGQITAEQVRALLGASDREFLFDFAQAVLDGDARAVMTRIDELMRAGREPQVFLRELSSHFRAVLTAVTVGDQTQALLDVTADDAERYRKQAAAVSRERLLRVLTQFMRAEGELRYASSPRIGLEATAVSACMPQVDSNAAALSERLAELESKLAEVQAALAEGVAPKAKKSSATAAAKEKPLAEAPASAALAATAAPGAKAAAPSDAQGVWDKLLESLKRTDPPLYGLIRNQRFLGAQGNVYRLQVPFAQKDFTYMKLDQPQRRDKLSAALTEAAGSPCVFEAVLEGDLTQPKRDSRAMDAQSALVEAFGRDLVQVDENTEI